MKGPVVFPTEPFILHSEPLAIGYKLLAVSSSVLVHPFHAAAVAVSAWATG